MNIIEIHLILNHIPIIGVAFVSLYLLIATIFKNTFMQKVSLWILLCVALLTIAVYLSGLGAETPVKSLPNVSKSYLQLHEKVARIASMTIWAIGGITLLGLISLRGKEQLFKYFVRGILAMTLLSTGLFILTGYLGGQITHSEIRSSTAEELSTRSLTLGVVAIMLVIVIAMIVPLLLRRSQLMESERQRSLDAAGSDSHYEPFDVTKESERQRSSAQFPKIALKDYAGNAASWPNSQLQRSGSEMQARERSTGRQFAFPSSPPLIEEQPDYENGDLRVPKYGPLIEENTRPLPKTAPIPIRPKGRKKLLVALSLLGVALLMGSLGFVVLHKLKSPPLPMQIIADIPLTGGANRFDYLYLDPHSRLLYLTHSASNTLTIFDTVPRKIVADIPGIRDVHAVAVAADLGLLFTTSATANQVVVIDMTTHAITARIPVGDNPDGLIYDPTDHKVFVADEAGQTDAVIDARTQQRIAEIPLGGDAGDIEYDAVSHHILAVVATLNQLVTIDPVTDKIIARAALPGCQSAQDLVLDELQRLAFVDCADNDTLLMLDMTSLKVISTQTVGKNPDLMALDHGWHYLYVTSESGVVSIFDEHGRAVKKLNEGYIAPGTHTIAVDQETHYMYLPLQNVGGKPILRIALFHP
jgi:YVTN family beta-propeller protein